MVEVAGVEPASYRASTEVSTSLVHTLSFSSKVLAVNRRTQKHLFDLILLSEDQQNQSDLYNTVKSVSDKPT